LVLKYFLFFFFILALCFVAIINDKIDFKNFNLKFTKFATLHFDEVHSISISENGINRVVEADSIIRYDNVDDILGLKVKIKKNGRIRYLNADLAHFYKSEKVDANQTAKEIFFEGNIVYVLDNNLTLKSEKMKYNFTQDLIICESLFTLTQGKNIISGNHFKYEVSKKIYSAKNIKSEIYLEE